MKAVEKPECKICKSEMDYYQDYCPRCRTNIEAAWEKANAAWDKANAAWEMDKFTA